MSPKLEIAIARGVLALLDAVKDAGWAETDARLKCREAGNEINFILDREAQERQDEIDRRERGSI